MLDQLTYVLEYEKLRNTGSTLTATEVRPLEFLDYSPGLSAQAEIRLDGLAPSTVYRVRVQFYSTRYLHLPAGGEPIAFDRPLGDWSDWYYTTTDAVRTGLKQARTRILLQGFYEYYRSTYLGEVGYLGSENADGMAYGASEGELWCSEFASFALDWELDIGSRASVASMESYFDQDTFSALVVAPSHSALRNKARRGDYLALQDENGDLIHSDLFLAYDVGSDRIWTLDGNTTGDNGLGNSYSSRRGGNEVFIEQRELTTTVDGVTFDTVGAWGRLKSDMLR
jgi:hypothetical protein